MLTSSPQLQSRSFHVVERTRTSSKCPNLKNARAKRAEILFFIVRYANLWRFWCRRRRGCLSSLKDSGHLRILEKCRKHLPAARVFYISLVFSNARRVLSQCNTRLRLLYLLNNRTLRALWLVKNPCFYQSTKHSFSPNYLHIVKQMKKLRPCIHDTVKTLRTWENSRNVENTRLRFVFFYISFVFSNVCRVLS